MRARPHGTDAGTSIDTVIIGGGQAGLALSAWLTADGVDHVVLERGRIADRWRHQRWDSLRLLTPNWHTRLPGFRYQGDDPDGYMHHRSLVTVLERYATTIDAPVVEGVTVESVTPDGTGLIVRTDQGSWASTNVVLATGQCALPAIPELAALLPTTVAQVPVTSYRNPGSLPEGRLLVVGSGASGQQIAAELAAAGRDVVLSVGRHSRLPRRYRDHDIIWWGDRAGLFDETVDDVPDPVAARRGPSLALRAGSHLDLGVLSDLGVTLAGHLERIDGHHAVFADDLGRSVAAADRSMGRFLDRIDRWVDVQGCNDQGDRPAPATWHDTGIDRVGLGPGEITGVVWATGFRPDLRMLSVPGVIGADGTLTQRRGVTPWPGLYVLGLRWQHRRKSSFIDGVGDDARDVADHIAARRHLRRAA